jgi:hypothetical protein
MDICDHEYSNYNGYYRCPKCDNRIHLGEFLEYQEDKIERLTQIEAAAKAIYFAGHWVRDNSSSEAEDIPLWCALKEATGWSLTRGG